MRSPWFNKKYMDVLLSDSWWIDVNDEFMELGLYISALSKTSESSICDLSLEFYIH